MTPTILTGKDPSSGRSLAIEITGRLISDVRPGPANETAWLSAGLIDLQINGYGGHDLNAEEIDANVVIALAVCLQQEGVTTFVPTLITASEAQIIAALRAIDDARRKDPLIARMIPYVHIEGPALSAEDGPRGAHPPEHIRPPSLAEFEQWQLASNGLVGMVTISPHWPNSAEYIANLTARGVHIAIGHTHATAEQIVAAADAGAVLSTHLGNGAHGILRRHPNYLWAQLAEDRMFASFIADGHHLPSDTLKVMLRAKGLERSILVSDTAALGGMAPGDYTTPIGGQVNLSKDGRLSLSGTPYLAAAALPLIAGVAHLVNHVAVPLADALRMATQNPGRLVDARGVIAIGASADLLRFRWSNDTSAISVETVMVAGKTVVGSK